MASKKTVAVCSVRRHDDEYKHFLSVLKEQCRVCVKYVHISSSMLENDHDFSQYDGVILIHSVSRGRMSLTDVRDVRYDTLLPHWKSLLGNKRVAVIITGVERNKDLEERLKNKQPTLFECSAHVLFCEARDPMNNDHVANIIESFVRMLPYQLRVRKVQAELSKATTKPSEDNSKKETVAEKIIAEDVKCAGIDVKISKDKIPVEHIICAEGSTRKTVLKTLSEDDFKNEADFLIFQHKAEVEERTQEKRSLQHEIEELERKCEESSASHKSLVNDNAILKSEIVCEKEKRKQVEMTLSENLKKASHAMEVYKQRELELEDKLKSKELHIGTMVENIQTTEETARREVERLKSEKEDERARSEKEKRSLAADMTNKLESKQQHVDTMTAIVAEKRRNEMTLTQQVEELKKGRDGDRARGEKEKRLMAAEIAKKLDSKQKHVDTMTAIVVEKERNEITLRQQLEELKKGRDGDRARGEKDKRSMATEMTKKVESKQKCVDTLTEIVEEKERNEETLRQRVEELKQESLEDRARFVKERWSIESSFTEKLDSKKQRIEQLERVTWKLRTTIQLESEIRSAEQKKKAETPQLVQRFIPWMNSGKLAQSGKTSSEDISTGQYYPSERSTTLQADWELPNDEFADILKELADDLSDGAKIDSLGIQLGILHGDIARALQTNTRYEQVTSRGTHLMLKQWREGVSREDERIELRRALVAAKLLDLADRYLPQNNEGDTVEDYRQRKEDSRQLSRIDSAPSVERIPEERTKTRETTSTTDQPHSDDMSSQKQKETF